MRHSQLRSDLHCLDPVHLSCCLRSRSC
jgi:hypothetical protein